MIKRLDGEGGKVKLDAGGFVWPTTEDWTGTEGRSRIRYGRFQDCISLTLRDDTRPWWVSFKLFPRIR
jgi:hypothetical protein